MKVCFVPFGSFILFYFLIEKIDNSNVSLNCFDFFLAVLLQDQTSYRLLHSRDSGNDFCHFSDIRKEMTSFLVVSKKTTRNDAHLVLYLP